MVLLFSSSKCGLCGELLENDGPVIVIPAFVNNAANPLYDFSDAAFHRDCLKRHPMGEHLLQIIEQHFSKTGPGRRKCEVCYREVMDWKDYLGTDQLTSNTDDPLYKYNYIHLHRSCLAKWELKESFIEATKEAIKSGRWKGDHLVNLLRDLTA